MATNTVEILVKSREDAAPDMDALRARLEELGREVATARADVDDADAAAKLDRLAAKLDELGHRTANPKIRMSGALRAEAEIHAVEASLDRLNRKADETAAKGGVQGLLGKLFFGLGSAAGGGGGPGGGILSTIFGAAGLGIVPAIEAGLSEVTALLSGFAAAGAGAGAFALLAVPAVKQVESAHTGLNTAQQAYHAAQAQYNEDPSKSNLTALQTTALNLGLVKDKLNGMPPAQQGAVGGVHNLATEFGKLSKAFQPHAFKVFADVLKIVDNRRPGITPLPTACAGASDAL